MKHILFFCSLFALVFFNSIFSFAQEYNSAETDSSYQTQTIEVDALKGIERKTPITFQDIQREEIVNKYWMPDLPMFLNGKTSITVNRSQAHRWDILSIYTRIDQRRILSL